jgi:hypothetical protein
MFGLSATVAALGSHYNSRSFQWVLPNDKILVSPLP